MGLLDFIFDVLTDGPGSAIENAAFNFCEDVDMNGEQKWRCFKCGKITTTTGRGDYATPPTYCDYCNRNREPNQWRKVK